MNVVDPNGRNWAAACHLAALVLGLVIPLGNLLGPLIIWLFKRNEYEQVEDQGKEVLNFQISIIIYGLVLSALMLIAFVTVILIPLAIIFLVLLACLLVFNLVMTIIGAVRASEGEYYRYPLAMRLIK